MSDSTLRRKRTRLGLLVIMVFSLALRLGAIDHGMPANYVPDTHIVPSALGMAKDKNLVPEVGLYSSYPNLLPYMLLPVYGAQYGAGRVTGEWGGATEFGNHALQHPESVQLPARILVALLSSLLPLVAFGAARAMGLGLGAWVAAWLAATGLLGVHFSMQERPWEPMVLFMLLSSWPAALYVTSESRRALVLSGAAVGLAFATHQGGGAALLMPAIAWLLVAVRNRSELGAKAKRLVLDGLLCVACFGVVGLVLGHPYLLVHGSTPTEAVVMGEELESVDFSFSLGGQAFVLNLRPESFMRLSKALIGYDPVLLILGLGGFLFAWRRRCMWPALIFLIGWGIVFLFGANDHVRYLLPLAGVLCLPAGLFVERLFSDASGGLSSSPVLRGVLGLLMFVPLVQAMRLGHVMGHSDVRAGAAEALLEPGQLPLGTRLAVGRYGPVLPMSKASLERLSEVRDLGARERYRLAFLTALETDGFDAEDPAIGPVGGAGIDLVYISDYFSFDDRKGTVWPSAPGFEEMTEAEVLESLGVTHILFADKTPGDGQLSFLAEKLPGLVAQSFWPPAAMEYSSGDPFAGSEGAAFEARLPTELDFAMTSIWKVVRPGPALYLFATGGVQR